MNVLTTFSGKYGDILWALPTVREISRNVKEAVDFGIMPEYRSLLPLLSVQPYIRRVFTIEAWKVEGSPYGDQPWQPPVAIEQEYEQSFHLAYRHHPGINRLPNIAVIDFIAEQQNIKLSDPVPFLEVPNGQGKRINPQMITYSFNEMHPDSKHQFLTRLVENNPDLHFIDVTKYQWLLAGDLIAQSLGYVGCRSSNWVIACGVGQKNLFIYEPDPSRNKHARFGITFGCPYVNEVSPRMEVGPEHAAFMATETINNWREQLKSQERVA